MRLAITPGDPDGIGPEIVWKAIRSGALKLRPSALLCIGAEKPFRKLRARIILADPNHLEAPKEKRPFIWLLPAPECSLTSDFAPGVQSGWSVETATRLVQQKICDALVTGPISKERLQKGGYPFTGHTDFLASLNDGGPVTMMLANDKLRVSLVTVHCGLKEVSKKVTPSAIERTVDQTAIALRDWWGIARPRIAVAALNPHAGESGLFGREEIEVIEPTLRRLRKRWGSQLTLVGPTPADTLFAMNLQALPKDRYDAVVCMYHDQGLIPVKLLDFPQTVNLTLGLPMIRTSVDHGTGFDIAGKNQADPSSFIAAVGLAAALVKRLNKTSKGKNP